MCHAFLGGALPGLAAIHLKQLNIFGMITRMPGSILHRHSVHALTCLPKSANSWLFQIRSLCIQYQLSHPLDLLSDPLSKYSYNKTVKSSVVSYWERKLRAEAEGLTSLVYFNPNYMSLVKPHPILISCGSNPFEVHKACLTLKMLAGRYLTDMLQRHWTPNKSGNCLLPACIGQETPGTLEHLLLFCPSLALKRRGLLNLAMRLFNEHPVLQFLLSKHLLYSTNPHNTMQFLIDCTSVSDVIISVQRLGPVIRDRLLYFGRTWCYTIHRERVIQLGLLKFR